MASSLNFIIPAAAMRGHLRLKVQVSVPGTSQTADDIVDIDASLLQTLKIRGIPVRYAGPDASGNQLDLPAPRSQIFRPLPPPRFACIRSPRRPRSVLPGRSRGVNHCSAIL